MYVFYNYAVANASVLLLKSSRCPDQVLYRIFVVKLNCTRVLTGMNRGIWSLSGHAKAMIDGNRQLIFLRF